MQTHRAVIRGLPVDRLRLRFQFPETRQVLGRTAPRKTGHFKGPEDWWVTLVIFAGRFGPLESERIT